MWETQAEQDRGEEGWLARASAAREGWKAAQGTHRELKPQQLRTKFILNHTPRSSQLIAELETIRELPNYCQLERANQAPVSHTPPGARH